MSTPVLQLRAVRKDFPAATGAVTVLRRVDLRIEAGEFVAITGPSGSGKSTCLHLAALLDAPSGGEVLLDGQDVSRPDDALASRLRARHIGMVFQKYCLLPHRSVLENVLFRFRYIDDVSRHDALARARHALDTLQIAHLADRPARLLSGGEMQRVGIARAIALQPRLLIADEPTGNLDQQATLAVMETFGALNRAGLTILMVTHNPQLLGHCTRHVSCVDGVIAA
jgi:putative ABC transport system ATP-binding protein